MVSYNPRLKVDVKGNLFYTVLNGNGSVPVSNSGMEPSAFGIYVQEKKQELPFLKIVNVPGLARRMIKESDLGRIVKLNQEQTREQTGR